LGGKYVCIDLIGVSSLVGPGVRDFNVERAALKAASSKMTKYEKVYFDNQYAFIPSAFDTFRFLELEAVVDLLKRVQRSCIVML
jgi:hypothetical protein